MLLSPFLSITTSPFSLLQDPHLPYMHKTLHSLRNHPQQWPCLPLSYTCSFKDHFSSVAFTQVFHQYLCSKYTFCWGASWTSRTWHWPLWFLSVQLYSFSHTSTPTSRLQCLPGIARVTTGDSPLSTRAITCDLSVSIRHHMGTLNALLLCA